MPSQKKPAKPAAKPAAKSAAKPVTKKPASKPVAKAVNAAHKAAKPAVKAPPTPATKVKPVPNSSKPSAKPVAKEELKKTSHTATATEEVVKKKPGRPPKAVVAGDDTPKTGAKRGRKPKAAAGGLPDGGDDADMSDIEADLVGEPVAETTEKVKPLRMKISKAKERALMKEFGLDETVLSEEDMAKRRQRLKTLITLGKTRGYLTQGEISDHLPDKLVDAETMEVVVTMLNDLGVAVYEQTPDAEMLLLNNTTPTASTVEEAEEEAEAALSTVDSEFGRTTDPVRMYMREMGTVELPKKTSTSSTPMMTTTATAAPRP
jgi:RNA polymerase primary sigma factor